MKSSNCVEVIGAGLGRTGTFSLKKALEILGLPSYHMAEVFTNRDFEFWVKVGDGKPCSFDEVFNRSEKVYKATNDYPSALYWKEQLQQYPNAKVILTIRDPEKWYKSASDTIFQFLPGSPHMPFGVRIRQLFYNEHLPMFRQMFYKFMTNHDWSKENLLNSFIRHNENVKSECPKDKLLVFEVSEGWEPLCKFLDKPIPDVPFPHVNDTAHFQEHIASTNRAGYAILAAIVIPLSMFSVGILLKCNGKK